MKLGTAALFAVSLFAGVGALAVPSAAQAQISLQCRYTAAEPTLRQGSSGTAVRQLQCELNNSLWYTQVTVDGSFGPATAAAVRTLQSCTGLAVDGIVGPQTWSTLNTHTVGHYVYC
ncbi:peptidoglycan-binding domain-containing protein [Cryptosporangium phraense]